ncbi:hypothetical protein CERZMDRAFT_90124 [Cercospora zeae-maydis SCOH1-5]|uniref:Uncharacterized protein n=1 Tax=Cercospora zeae-maydis SCOH1-5 TaxID=717836 RepID=A0A6A6FQC5_9PEZI|nr:hypothetical protein CERZMDRAFT_90124 [Cercospora zeae-maydis SCOH1-5]
MKLRPVERYTYCTWPEPSPLERHKSPSRGPRAWIRDNNSDVVPDYAIAVQRSRRS